MSNPGDSAPHTPRVDIGSVDEVEDTSGRANLNLADITGADALGWKREPDAFTGHFGGVSGRDALGRVTEVDTHKANYKVAYNEVDGEVETITWGGSGEVWRRNGSTYEIGNQRVMHLRVDAKSGAFTFLGPNSEYVMGFPDGKMWTEGANRARRAAAATA